MAAPRKGAWARRSQPTVPYVAGNWGTGIHDVHLVYGSPPARLGDLHPREGEITPPYEAVPQELYAPSIWGYEQSPTGPVVLVYDDRPSWGSPEDDPTLASTFNQPPLNASGYAKMLFRATRGGAHRIWRGKAPRADYMVPSETVSEGWLNKPHGQPANSKPSDPSQYEIQTAMRQRYLSRINDHAVGRGTDDARAPIASRVTGQRTPKYSTGERLYDMFPYQQMDFDRPFWYRTAGTGDPDAMGPNEMWDIEAVERVPPPDPYIGTPDESVTFGYTPEDQFYA